MAGTGGHRFGWFASRALFLAWFLALIPGPIFADTASWSPELLATQADSYRNPGEPVRILLPEDISTEVLQQLGLELDAIDVSAMAVFEDGVIVYVPVQPLSHGLHVLRLVEYAQDGSILERGYWNLDIRQSENYSQAAFNAAITLTASQRVGDKNIDADPDRLQGQGGASLGSVIADEGWQVDSRADLIYNSQHEQTPNGHQLDLGEYLLTGNTESTELRVGHHAVPQNNFTLDNFYRRGISGDIGISSLRSTVTGFSMRSEQITGFNEGLGVGDSDNRVDGVLLHSQPLSNNPERLDLLFSYLDGEGPAGTGTNVAGQDSVNTGSAWSVAIDSALLAQQLRLRGEYSGTDYDFDGKNTGFNEESDEAWSALALYTPTPSGTQESPLYWSIGAEHMNVGTFFKSLANTSLSADREMTRLFGSLSLDTWAMESSFAREEDNLDDDALLPTTRTYQGYATLSYSPFDPIPEDSFFSWLGTPSHSIALAYIDQEETDTPAGSATPETDNRTDSAQLQSAFMLSTWNWGGGFGWNRFRDYSGASPDSRTLTANMNAAFPVGERVYLSPSVEFQTTKDEDSGVKQHAINWGLTAGISFIPEKLDGNFSFTLNQNKTTNDPLSRQDEYTILVSGDVVWHWIAARTNRPGFDVSLNGIWQNVNDDVTPALEETSNQVFLNFTMTLPLSAPGGL
ncbi:MAG: hypothetical protein JRG79_11285 [Deltaproteobacteria bacterium]|nr:hypothetical protein [Deltaproteobacteria bacterium]